MATKEEAKNEQIARELCREMVRTGIARTAAFISAGSNEQADVWLAINDQRVLVELCVYRRHDRFVQAENIAEELEGLANRTMQDVEKLRGLRVFIAYRRNGGGSVAVPPSHNHVPFLAECSDLLRWFVDSAAWQSEEYAVLLFDPPPLPAVMLDEHRNYKASPVIPVDRKAYPVMSKGCYGLMVRRTHGYPLFESDLNRRSRPPDEQLVRDVVQRKLKKLPRYRTNANGARCWLVIHSEPRPLPAWVHPSNVDALASIASEELSRTKSTFDAAYWFNREEVGRTHPITPIVITQSV